MKIAFTIAHMTIGGAQRVCHHLIEWMQENTDTEVILLIYSRLIVGEISYSLQGINHIYVSDYPGKKIYALRTILKQVRPDLLVTFGTTGTLFDVPAAFGLGIKHIVCERNDPAHFGGKTTTRVLSRLLMRAANGYVFQTKDAQDFYGGNIARHSTVIPNPIFGIEDMPVRNSNSPREKVIVSVGRLNKQKNHPLLIRAFHKIKDNFPDYKLVIYGAGPEEERDKQLIEELGLRQRVELPGSRNNIFELINNASLFVLSSDFEGMPNALMEAMALGLPCISTDCPCGGPKDLLENGKNGVLIKVKDEEALTTAMSEMLTNTEKAEEMGSQAMNIRKTHSLDAMCSLWYDYFKQIAHI